MKAPTIKTQTVRSLLSWLPRKHVHSVFTQWIQQFSLRSVNAIVCYRLVPRGASEDLGIELCIALVPRSPLIVDRDHLPNPRTSPTSLRARTANVMNALLIRGNECARHQCDSPVMSEAAGTAHTIHDHSCV
jgi:hypothetical protein